jgi:histidyl-tRNA synthetase
VADLKSYLQEHLESVPANLRARIDVNPLRLFDAKDEAVQELLGNFKPIKNSLCDDCRDHFDVVLDVLEELEVPHEEDPALVRGLDYYCRTTFEITAEAGRKQSSLAGGGRYDYLVEQCGGPPTPAVGFSVGVERTLLHLDDDPVDLQRSRQSVVDIYVACKGREAQQYGFVSAEILRGYCRVEVDTSDRSLKSQAKSANLRQARFLLTVGEEEIAGDFLQLKNLATGEQMPVARGQILTAVREVLEG